MPICSKGRAKPGRATRDNLFADSGGFCQRPECGNYLFNHSSTKRITIAEMAHIFAASDGGSRPPSQSMVVDRNHYDNLVLLCPNCHTAIDKDEESYPVEMIQEWKVQHRATVSAVFETPRFSERCEARRAIEQRLAENRHVWEQFGPHGDNSLDPESSKAAGWKRECVNTIIPNNGFLLSFLNVNRDLLNDKELETVAKFRVHATGFALRHLTTDPISEVTTFPPDMDGILL